MDFLVIDIGSDSVGASGVVKRRSDGVPFLLFTAREPIAPAPHLEPKHFFSATLSALRVLLEKSFSLHRAEISSIRVIHIFLHSPWIVSKTRAVRADFKEPVFLSVDVLGKAVRDAEEDIEEKFRAAHIDISSAVRIVEKKIIEFRVNGYEVASALNKKANSLEFALLESFVPENAVEKFGATLENVSGKTRELHGAVAALAVSASAAPSELSHNLHAQACNSAFISVGGEASEIALSRNGVVREVVSIPRGFRSLARMAFEEGTFHSVSSAESFFAQPSERATKFVKAREKSIQEYRKIISDFIELKKKAGFFCNNFSFCCDGKYQLFFKEALSNLSPSLRFEDFEGVVERSRSASADPFLMGEAFFLSLF